jgi:hypothetical protein
MAYFSSPVANWGWPGIERGAENPFGAVAVMTAAVWHR